jgi:hypothetical protein
MKNTNIKTQYNTLGVANQMVNSASTALMNVIKRLANMHNLEDKDITQDMIIRFTNDHQSKIPTILTDDGLLDVPTALVKYSDKAFEKSNKTNDLRLIAICLNILGFAQGLKTKVVKDLRSNGRTTGTQNEILQNLGLIVRNRVSNDFTVRDESMYLPIIAELADDFTVIRGLELSKPKVVEDNDTTESKTSKRLRVRFEEDTIELFCNVDCKTIEKGLRHFGPSNVENYGECGTCNTKFSDALAQPFMAKPNKKAKPTAINDSLLNEFLDTGKLEIVEVK